MLKAMRLDGSPPPVFETDKNRTCFLVRLRLHPTFVKEAKDRKRQATGQVTGQVATDVLQFCEQPRKANEIQTPVGVKHRESFQDNYLKPLMAIGWLVMTMPDKRKSRLQRYQTTEEGKQWLLGTTNRPPTA